MLRILLADDHAAIRRAFRLILAAEPGWTVCAEASSGDEAVTLAALHRPQVVILDVVMPGLSGFDAARQIGLTCTDCAIVIVTMHKGDEVLHAARAAGALSLLNKSDADEHLVPAVRALSQGESYFLSDSDRASRVS
jgi:DNA-binding NarL/FixJ family response regulator